MSSWHGGGGYTSRDGLSARPAAGNDHQVQIHIGDKFDFDREVDDLRGLVGNLKHMTKTIDEERRQQGQIINSLEDAMERAKLGLRRANQRLNIAYKQARSNHLLFLVLFAMAVFFGVYVLARMYRLGRGIFGH